MAAGALGVLIIFLFITGTDIFLLNTEPGVCSNNLDREIDLVTVHVENI